MKTPPTMDFASATMVRVLTRGMHVLGFQAPVIAENLHHATVPLDLKRAVVQAAVEQGGLVCLPLLGRGLHDLAQEPTHLALTAGSSAAALFVRWQRLERYIHSRHRIRLVWLSDHVVQIDHIHKDNGAPPLAVEDLVVCGVLCALLEANGLESVRAEASGGELYPNPDDQMVANAVHRGLTGTWHISWRDTRDDKPLKHGAVTWSQVAPPLWSPLANSVGDRVAQHLPQLLPLDDVAVQVGISRRSLQRTLAREGLSYTQLLAEVRFRLAGWYLLHWDMPIAEVGFVCGFADQAHLTREFNRRVGVPPARFRELFSPT